MGRLTVIDRDYVEPSNLQRQWLFTEEDATNGTPKAVAVRDALGRINSHVKVQAHVSDLLGSNAAELLGTPDVILDGADNFETRYVLNDYAVRQGIAWIYGAAVGSHGVTMPVVPGETACLRCLFPEAPGAGAPTCDTVGVLGSVTASVAAQQVADAIKLLAMGPGAVRARLLEIDVWNDVRRSIATAERDPECPACGRGEFPFLADSARGSARMCGRDAVQIAGSGALDLAALGTRLAPLGAVRANKYLVRFSNPPHELTVFADGRAIVKGVEDVSAARSLYARYIGG